MTAIEFNPVLSGEGQLQRIDIKEGHVLIQPVTEDVTPGTTPEQGSPIEANMNDVTKLNGTTDETARKLAETLTLDEQVSCSFRQTFRAWASFHAWENAC